MKKVILALGLLAFSVPIAGACEYQRSAQAKSDPTIVASIVKEQSSNMSVPAEKEAVQQQITDQN